MKFKVATICDDVYTKSMKKLAIVSPCVQFTKGIVENVSKRVGAEFSVLEDAMKKHIVLNQPTVSKMWNQSVSARSMFKQDIIIESAKNVNESLVLFDMSEMLHVDAISLLKGIYYFCNLEIPFEKVSEICTLEEKTLYNEYSSILKGICDYNVAFQSAYENEALFKVCDIMKSMSLS